MPGPTYPRITSADLRALGACSNDLRTFRQLFPEGAAIPRADLVKKALIAGIDVLWLADRIHDEIPEACDDAHELFAVEERWWVGRYARGPVRMTDREHREFASYMAPRTAAFLRKWFPTLLEKVL